MPIYALDGQGPDLPAEGDYFVAESAVLIGRVRLRRAANIWFNAVLRGDNEWIEIGEAANIQDNATLHTDPGFPLFVGERCTVGHAVILHGCTIGPNCLIGMGAIMMNGSRLGANCLVGAGAVITEGKEFPANTLVLGAPARATRTLDAATADRIAEAAKVYDNRWQQYRKGLSRVG
jgi:carbonic anhydrase/acetyltransferase-like protein (isoleucine patch superfamily)